MQIYKWFFLLITFIGLSACIRPKEEKPANLIEPSKMTQILTDLQLADAYIAIQKSESKDIKQLATHLQDSLFKKHQITRAQFDTSMKWYAAHAEELDKIYDQVIQQLELMKEQNKTAIKHN